MAWHGKGADEEKWIILNFSTSEMFFPLHEKCLSSVARWPAGPTAHSARHRAIACGSLFSSNIDDDVINNGDVMSPPSSSSALLFPPLAPSGRGMSERK